MRATEFISEGFWDSATDLARRGLYKATGLGGAAGAQSVHRANFIKDFSSQLKLAQNSSERSGIPLDMDEFLTRYFEKYKLPLQDTLKQQLMSVSNDPNKLANAVYMSVTNRMTGRPASAKPATQQPTYNQPTGNVPPAYNVQQAALAKAKAAQPTQAAPSFKVPGTVEPSKVTYNTKVGATQKPAATYNVPTASVPAQNYKLPQATTSVKPVSKPAQKRDELGRVEPTL